MKTIRLLLLVTFLFSLKGFSQRGHGHGHGHNHGHRHGKKVVVVKRSPYRPRKVVVYHPVWHPKYACNRRWVFFPKYNLYWDNWRNHYMFWNGTIWISQPTPPPVIVNVNLESEKHYELKEKEDDEDDVYKGNDSHKTEYKTE
ncbi:MAG: hypothetical protein K0S32_2633 [Bacteroidetes bacterium]|jgi:hypothetical protein|nr:hypothetical protein [Bacteroidota bacterium]